VLRPLSYLRFIGSSARSARCGFITAATRTARTLAAALLVHIILSKHNHAKNAPGI
jgi:hypothetical protein